MSLFRVVQAGSRSLAASRPALLAPQQNISLTYSELAAKATSVSKILEGDYGVRPGDIVVTNLPNVAEGVVVQLALQRLGAACATVKNLERLRELETIVGAKVRTAVLAPESSTTSSWLSDYFGSKVFRGETIDLCGTAPDNLQASSSSTSSDIGPDSADFVAGEIPTSSKQQPVGFFNSSKPLLDGEITQLGDLAQNKLAIEQQDRVAIAITLYHQFSHMMMHATFSAGACLILPAVGGLHGCGIPAERAKVTLDVLATEKCSLLAADTHTLTALNSDDDAAVARLGEADLSALRGGVCKVASGAEFLEETVELKGVKLATLGSASSSKGV